MAALGRSFDKGMLPAWVVVALVVVIAPLALGGVTPPALAGLGGGCGLALVLVSRGRQRQGRRVAPGLLPGVLAAGVVYSLLQCVPLPLGLLRVLSPHAAQLVEVMNPGATHGTLTGDVVATLTAACRLAAVAALLAACLDLARDGANRVRLLALVASSSGVLLAVSAYQTASGFKGPFGAYPRGEEGLLVTTFINSNHGAAALLIGVFALVGLGMAAAERAGMLQAAGAALVLAAGVMACGSNGAVLAMVAGAAVTAVLAWRAVAASKVARDSDDVAPGRGSRTLALLVLGLTVPLALLATEGPDIAGMRTRAEGAMALKQESIAQGWSTVRLYGVTGLGRGAFEDVFPRHKTSPRQYTFNSPENIEVLLLLEWGVGFALLYMAAWAAVVLEWIRRARSAAAAAALGGVVALWAHNQVDFNLEVLGVALPFCALLAAGRPSQPHAPGTTGSGSRARRFRTAALVAGLVTAVLVPAGGVLASERSVRASRHAAMARPPPQQREALVAHVHRHPTDYVATLRISRLARGAHPPELPEAMSWVNRTIFLHPGWPDARMDAGRILYAMGYREQAALEMTAAVNAWRPAMSGRLVREIMSRDFSEEQLLAMFSHLSPSQVCGGLAAHGQEGRAERCLIVAATRQPPDTGAQLALGQRAVARGELDEADGWASDVLKAQPANADAVLLAARVLDARGDLPGADALLDKARRARADPVEIERFRLARALARNRLDEARDALVGLSNALTGRGESQYEVMVAEARIEMAAGNPREAMVHYRNAARARPGDPGPGIQAARLVAMLVDRDAAIRLLRELLVLSPQTEYVKEINAIEHGTVARPNP